MNLVQRLAGAAADQCRAVAKCFPVVLPDRGHAAARVARQAVEVE